MSSEAPSQPSQQTGVEQSKNPADQTTAEHNTASSSSDNAPTTESRSVPSNRSEDDSKPTSTAMGYGERGPLRERDTSESDKQNYSNKGNLEGEQMRAPGEGEVADAVQSKGDNPDSGHGEEESLMGNMGAKAEAHADELHAQGKKTGKEINESGGGDDEDEDWTGMREKVDLNAALGREGTDGEVTEVGETERGTGVVLAAESVSGTAGGNDAREGLGDA